MAERALATPFDTEEIIEISVQEFRRRLKNLSPLQGMKQYAGFELSFHTDVKLFGMATNGGGTKETLAWGTLAKGDMQADAADAASDASMHKSDVDVNEERLAHDLPLTVEHGDGKGGKITKKVRVKGERESA